VSVPLRTPSTKNSTFVTPTLSEALAEIVIVPDTIVPAVGDVREVVGDMVSERGGVEDTVTVALWLAEPPAPEQEMVYVVLDEGEMVCVPEVPLVPFHPPDAVHDVALVELHVSVDDWPDVMDEGEAERVTVGEGGGGGGGGGVTCPEPLVGTRTTNALSVPPETFILLPKRTSFPSGLMVACGCAQ